MLSTFFSSVFENGKFSQDVNWGIAFLVMIFLCLIFYFISKKILVHVVARIVKNNRYKWDDYMYERGVFNRLSLIVPALIVHIFSNFFAPHIQLLLQQIVMIYLVAIGISTINALLSSLNDIYQTYEISKNRPIKGYLQVIKIILYVIGGILIISSITGKSPLILLSGISALSAVLLIIFKDSLLGLVAGIQLSANDMVRIGDWIEMPNFNADGDVIDITLNTVKVRNFDKTITTIPTYALVSNAFKNWRGMSESGGRRIKRSICIDVTSVKFLDEAELKALEHIQLLLPYLKKRLTEIESDNARRSVNTENPVNGRRLTNIGVFRKYLELYLKHHSEINQNMTLLVRQLDPNETGVQIEIYAFASTTEWGRYEAIQSDIFDHIFAAVSYFDLRIFQQPTGSDFKRIISHTSS